MTMLEPAEVIRRLGYHPATDATAPAFETNRAAAILVAELWNQALPPGREAALALTALQEALMWANAAIACNAGDDWSRPAVDVSELVDDLLEHLEGPLHLRSSATEPSFPAEGDGSAVERALAPPEGVKRTVLGDCTATSPAPLPFMAQRCELIAGHDGAHRRALEVWS